MADPRSAAREHDVLHDPRIEAFGMVIEAHNELVHVVNRRLDEEVGVPIPWLNVLVRLARSPGERLRMTQLAREMTMSTSGLTRLVDRIEAAGHVRREACPEDRRGFHAVLTPAGREIAVDACRGHVEDLERYLAGPLGTERLDELTGLLRTVRDHIRSQAGAGSVG